MASETKDGTGEQYLYSEEVRRRLLNVFQEMTNKISPANFNEIFKQLEDSGKNLIIKNGDQIVQQFKDDLYRNICDNFKEMWHLQEIDQRLNQLKFCKEKCKNNTTAWRPTGKTPEEQTKYLRIHYLKKKISFLNDALKCQAATFTGTCEEVQAKREMIENQIAKRDEISRKMDARMAQLNKVDYEYQSLLKDLIE